MLRWLTSGESHGPQLTVVIEGLPSGLEISEDDLRKDLARRQGGHGRGGRQKIETDFARIVSKIKRGKVRVRLRAKAGPHVASTG